MQSIVHLEESPTVNEKGSASVALQDRCEHGAQSLIFNLLLRLIKDEADNAAEGL